MEKDEASMEKQEEETSGTTTAFKEEETSTSQVDDAPAPVSPRKLPALGTTKDVKATPTLMSPLSQLVGPSRPTPRVPEKPGVSSQSLGSKRFSARIANLKKSKGEAMQSSLKKTSTSEDVKIDPTTTTEVAAREKARVESVRKEEGEEDELPSFTETTMAEAKVTKREEVDPPRLTETEAPKPPEARTLKFDISGESHQRSEAGPSRNVAALDSEKEESSLQTAEKSSQQIPQEMIYVWDENTGILKTIRERDSKHESGLKARYVEDAITGTFQKVTGRASLPKRAWGKASKKMRINANPLSLKLMYDTTSNIFGVVYLFLQGALGGLSLLSLYFFLLLDGSTPNAAFLRFYSPLSMAFSRTFFTLIVMAILGAYDKFNKDWMLQFEPVGPSQRTLDICLLILYVVALLCSVINTGYDDLMHYSYRRVPDWYDLQLSSDFKSGYGLWYALSIIKVFCCAVAWALVSFELRPKLT